MKYLQHILFERALIEAGIKIERFRIDHGTPINYNGGKKYPFIFPQSFLKDIEPLWSQNKIYDYIFLGSISGSHRQFLKKWDKPKSLISPTRANKFAHPGKHPQLYPENFFNKKYFEKLCQSKFCLAPGGSPMNQAKFLKNKKFIWSYRFYEACLCKCIPITNEPDPNLHPDFKFYSLEEEHVYRKDWVEQNLKTLKNNHFLI